MFVKILPNKKIELKNFECEVSKLVTSRPQNVFNRTN
jgi:hypothetical protein